MDGASFIEAREQALAIARAGLAAADGYDATRRSVSVTDSALAIGDSEFELFADSRVIVLGGGKATLPVARALEDILGDRIAGGAVVLKRGDRADLGQIEALHADHPFPSPASVAAARRIKQLADEAQAGDLVITCFTGGRSALLSLPPSGVSFEEKRELHRLLLTSGMTISEINTVRKHVSRIKGGRLAAAVAPARLVNLTISDVAGDRLDILADLTSQDHSSPFDALLVLERHGLLETVPESILRHLEAAPDAPDLSGIEGETVMLVNGQSVCAAMAETARSLGLEADVLSTSVEGAAEEVGRYVGAAAIRQTESREGASGTALIGCGGEATVRVGPGEFGLGGPNQEAAVAAALEIEGEPVAAVFLDTDGSDGSTAVAGAICDGMSVHRARELGLDLAAALPAHATTAPLEALSDLIVTGPTGTNVNDLFVAVTSQPG